MNKNIAIVITAVILLGMALITYNEYTSPVAPPLSAQNTITENPMVSVSAQPSTPPAAIPENNGHGTMATAPKTAPMVSAVPASKPSLAQAPVTTQAPATAPAPVPTPKAQPAPVAKAPEIKPAPVAKVAAPVPSPAPAPASPKVTEAPKTESPKAQAPKPVPPKTTKAQDPVQKALAASRKESTLPTALIEPAKTAPKKPAVPAEKIIKRIYVLRVGDGITVRLDSNQPPTYTTMRLTAPERLVIDLDGTWKMRAPGVPANALVSNVRIGDHKEGSRIVIDLKKIPSDIRYLKYEETGLDIRLR